MELQLKNIGMIKEANIKLDGLTVIAGENDTGKSTVGKALYLQLKFLASPNMKSNLSKKLIKLIFENQISSDGNIVFKFNGKEYQTMFDEDRTIFMNLCKNKFELFPIIIETPLVWNFNKFFNQLSIIESYKQILDEKIEVDYPFLMKDLSFKLSIKRDSEGILISQDIFSIIKGKFEKDNSGQFFFNKENKKIELLNTATGIKYFGILQVLSENNYLGKNTVLVLDEPEVHLHPKWQLELAKIIVHLVKNGVTILVNSHSPYMIEALQRYGEKEQINMDFYLAEDGKIAKVEDSNSQTLAQIFEKLSEPFDVFEEMDSQSMEKLING